MNKVELLASFPGRSATVGRRGNNHLYDTIYRVRFRREPPRIECSCGCTLAYSPEEHDVDNLRVLNEVCAHIIALYVGAEHDRKMMTALGREMFTWCWAQRALENST